MLLRASSKAVEQDVEVQATMGGHGAELVEHGEALVAFAEAVTRGDDNIEDTRNTLVGSIGVEAFSEEVREASPDTRLVIPRHLESIRLLVR